MFGLNLGDVSADRSSGVRRGIREQPSRIRNGEVAFRLPISQFDVTRPTALNGVSSLVAPSNAQSCL